jgi:hypothetical protein
MAATMDSILKRHHRDRSISRRCNLFQLLESGIIAGLRLTRRMQLATLVFQLVGSIRVRKGQDAHGIFFA